MKTRLSKKEIAAIISVAERVNKLWKKYDKENGTDIALQIKENGTVGECLGCAVAALDTIIQEYV